MDPKIPPIPKEWDPMQGILPDRPHPEPPRCRIAEIEEEDWEDWEDDEEIMEELRSLQYQGLGGADASFERWWRAERDRRFTRNAWGIFGFLVILVGFCWSVILSNPPDAREEGRLWDWTLGTAVLGSLVLFCWIVGYAIVKKDEHDLAHGTFSQNFSKRRKEKARKTYMDTEAWKVQRF